MKLSRAKGLSFEVLSIIGVRMSLPSITDYEKLGSIVQGTNYHRKESSQKRIVRW